MSERLAEIVVKRKTRDLIAKLKENQTYDNYLNQLIKNGKMGGLRQDNPIRPKTTHGADSK